MDFFINLPGLGVNAKDELGRTSLHYSCETDFQGLTKHLIVIGADVNAQDNEGITPMMLAAMGDFSENILTLINHKANKLI